MGGFSVQKVGNPVCEAVCSSDGNSHHDNLHLTAGREVEILFVSFRQRTLL